MYSVNWTTKVIYIPVSDMQLISGTEYILNMSDFHKEIRRLEWDYNEGMWADQVLEHQVEDTIAGTVFVPKNKIINGYTILFDPTATKVFLKGDNNNIVDVFIYNGVSVIPSNTAGNTVTQVGSGLSAQQAEDLTWLRRRLSANEEKNVVLNKWYLRDEDTDALILEKNYNKDANGNETLTKQ